MVASLEGWLRTSTYPMRAATNAFLISSMKLSRHFTILPVFSATFSGLAASSRNPFLTAM
jgi:hypothetical protein